MAITVLKNNAPWGPFSREQIKEGLLRGDFTLHYLAHAPGLATWLPLGEVIDHVERTFSLPPLPGGEILPPVPSRNTAPVLPPPLPPVAERPPSSVPESVAPEPEPVVSMETAPFFTRVMAFLIDCAILFVPVLLIFIISGVSLELQGIFRHDNRQSMHEGWMLLIQNVRKLFLLMAIGLGWIYGAGLESSPWQGTLGKQWLGIRVVDLQGKRIGLFRATGRHAAKYLSAVTCLLGFLMALFGSRGLALHDRLAGTRVIRR